MKNDSSAYVLSAPELKPRESSQELRLGRRVDIRPGDGVSADIFIGESVYAARVWDIMTTGLCLVLNDAVEIVSGSIVEVRLNFAWGESLSASYEVRWVTAIKEGGVKLGLKISEVQPGSSTDLAVEESMARISPAYPIIGYIFKEIHYQERSIFRLVSISSTYVLLDIIEQEHLFLPGQKIELLFSLQSAKNDKLNGQIVQIQASQKESVRVLIKVENLLPSLEADLINHLILDPSLSPEKIRQAGFRIKSIANNFRFRFVKTQEEYEKVLDLRFEAYRGAGKTKENATSSDMVAPLDKISRILVAYHGDTVVASVALSFPQSQDVVLDTERALSSGYPDSIPPKTEMIEVARLCTHPNYRRGDLLLRMFEHIYKVFATSGRKYLISSTDKKLWPIYKNLGFKKTGLKYAHPFLAGLEHEIILIDILVPVTGAEIGFLRWWYLYSQMTTFVEARKKLERFGFAKLRFQTYSFAAKLIGHWKKLFKK